MRRTKEKSVGCRRCGELWNDDLSNKYPKRALCIPCHKIEYAERKIVWKEKHKNDVRKVDLMQPFKVQNRLEHWRAVNKEIRKLKKYEEIHQFIQQKADEIFANKELMDFINHQSL